MTTHTDVGNPFHRGHVTVLLSTRAADLETCVRVLGESGIRSSVETFNFSGEEQLVEAAIPHDRKPSQDDIEASKRAVGRVLSDSHIPYEIRGAGYDSAPKDDVLR